MQEEFYKLVRMAVSPMDVFIEYDQATNKIFYGIDWGPRDVFAALDPRINEPLFGIVWGKDDGQRIIVRHGISDEQLNRLESDALRKGYERRQVRTVTINGVNLHIGLWVETESAPQR